VVDSVWGLQFEHQFSALPVPLRAIDRVIIKLTEWSLACIGALFTVMIALQVLSRYVLGFSTFFISAAAQFLLLWFFLFGAGLALRYGAHVGFELLVSSLTPRVQRIVKTIAQFLALVFFMEMIWGGVMALGPAASQTDSALGASLVWGFLAVPVGFGMLAYHMLILIIADLRTPLAEDAPP
jgi:TRAP-type transport system small permease protein